MPIARAQLAPSVELDGARRRNRSRRRRLRRSDEHPAAFGQRQDDVAFRQLESDPASDDVGQVSHVEESVVEKLIQKSEIEALAIDQTMFAENSVQYRLETFSFDQPIQQVAVQQSSFQHVRENNVQLVELEQLARQVRIQKVVQIEAAERIIQNAEQEADHSAVHQVEIDELVKNPIAQRLISQQIVDQPGINDSLIDQVFQQFGIGEHGIEDQVDSRHRESLRFRAVSGLF